MGYMQDLTVVVRQTAEKGKEVEAINVLLDAFEYKPVKSFDDVVETKDGSAGEQLENVEIEDNGGNWGIALRMRGYGKYLYENAVEDEERGAVLFGDPFEKPDPGVNVRQLSKKLGCRIECEYFGEEQGDTEIVVYENGVEVRHQTMNWVDVH